MKDQWLMIGNGWYNMTHIERVGPNPEIRGQVEVRCVDGTTWYEDESMETFDHHLRSLVEEG